MGRSPKEQGVALTEIIIVVAIMLVVAAIAVPSFISTRRNYRALGDAQTVAAEILLAKMRASSDFTQARARFDTSANTYQLEIWNKSTGVWAVDAPTGTMSFSSGISPGYGAQTNPPPNTQASIAQAAPCKVGASGASPGADISNTACVVFNSRGIPIDTSGTPANTALYITDAKGVYATTVGAAGLIQNWRIDVNDTTQAHWNLR